MRKSIVIMGILLCCGAVLAMPTNDTNIALDIHKPIRTTFENTGGMFDGVISSDPQFSARSGNFYDKYQEAFVELPKPFYVREIRIYWDKAAYYPNYLLQISTDGSDLWEVEASARKEEVKGNSLVHTFTLPGALVAAVRLAVQGDPKDNPRKGAAIVQELEIYPRMEDRIVVEDTKTLFTDTEAFVRTETNIQAQGVFKYRPAGSTADYSTGGYGRLNEAATAVGLTPGTSYEYYVQLQDFNANVYEGQKNRFQTRAQSLAAKAKVTGTFLNGNTSGNRNILVDGDLEKEASSGSIYDQDQELVIDLGGTLPVSEVIVYWSRLAYSKDYSVLGSADGREWVLLAKGQDAAQGLLGRTRGSLGGRPMNVVDTGFKQQLLRHIKVLIARNSDFYHKHTTQNFVDVFEVKAF